ncbi:MAG: DUF433 domain-containing protein [Candidatus Acidiferrales bacterium]
MTACFKSSKSSSFIRRQPPICEPGDFADDRRRRRLPLPRATGRPLSRSLPYQVSTCGSPTFSLESTYVICSGIVTMEPGKRSGKPCVRGLRITAHEVLENLASGMSHGEFLQEFPYLTEQDIRACLAFAADRERKVKILNA